MADFNLGQAGQLSTVASGALSIYSTLEQGKLRRIINRHNAIMKDNEIKLIRIKTDQLIDRLGEKEQRELAASRVASVGEGFALDSGTNLAIDGDIIRADAIDRAVIRTSGSLEEARTSIEGREARLRGEIAGAESRVQAVKTLFGTTTSLLKTIDK